MQEIDQLKNLDLEVDQEAGQHFYSAGKWARFISIVAFCCIGLALIFLVVALPQLSRIFRSLPSGYSFLFRLGPEMFVVAALIAMVIIGYVYYLLFMFGQKVTQSVPQNDMEQLTVSLRSLKLFFIVSTILSIISLLFSLINFTDTINI
jgi:uncharacterized membrane protein YjgN (DUF898 family)